MAPGAQIVLVETLVAQSEGFTGLPELMHAEWYALQHDLADLISQSFDVGEGTFKHLKQDIESVRLLLKEAASPHVPVVAANGDAGPEDYNPTGDDLVPGWQASWLAGDPLVTSIGGTEVRLDAAGKRTQPDEVWNESDIFGGAAAGGGDRSAVFAGPAYQDGVEDVVRDHRGYPDISMNAAVYEPPILYWSIPGQPMGFIIGVGGTSAATPLFAGFTAVAEQLAGRDVGPVNDVLYKVHDRAGLGEVDVTIGNNDVPGTVGFAARRGYDLTSGWGTIDGARLAAVLAVASHLHG